jgi:hypothetical protein
MGVIDDLSDRQCGDVGDALEAGDRKWTDLPELTFELAYKSDCLHGLLPDIAHGMDTGRFDLSCDFQAGHADDTAPIQVSQLT